MPQPASAAVAKHARIALAIARDRFAARFESLTIAFDGSTRFRARPPSRSRRFLLSMTDESTFIAAADRTLAALGTALDRAIDATGADVDWSLNDGILEIDAEDGGKVIVNRHAPNRELWVAAKSGGFHYRASGGRWIDTRSGTELGAALSAILRAQAGLAVELDLEAPADRV